MKEQYKLEFKNSGIRQENAGKKLEIKETLF